MTTATRTLDAAQQAGIAAADQAVAQAMRNLQDATKHLQAVKAQQARIYEAVGLDPARRYSIDRETGEVTETRKGSVMTDPRNDGAHVVIGAGEVGRAVAEVLSAVYEVHLRDIEPTGTAAASVLHICFPYSPGFEAAVSEYQQAYRMPLVIVHSTVPVGTCDRLRVTHSPVRGRHPHLAESIRRFTKFFGGPRASAAAEIFRAAGVKSVVCQSARDTEAGKLWELLQYGIAVTVEKAIFEYCALEGVDFDTVYTAFAETYNAGYQAVGEPQFTRPVLTHMPGPIGGHCVVPGSMLLGHPLAQWLVEAREVPA